MLKENKKLNVKWEKVEVFYRFEFLCGFNRKKLTVKK